MIAASCRFLFSLLPSKLGPGWPNTIFGGYAKNTDRQCQFHSTSNLMRHADIYPETFLQQDRRVNFKTPVRYSRRDLHIKCHIYLGFLSRELHVNAFVFLPFIHIHNGTCSAIVRVLPLIKTLLQLSEVKTYFKS
jgi:hypothetical protein